MESKNYNKLVNATNKKQTDRYREQTSGSPWGGGSGSPGPGDWMVQSPTCCIVPRRDYRQHFVTVNGK